MTQPPDTKDMPRLALVTNVLAHYRVPCFARLSELMEGRAGFYFLTGAMEHRKYVFAEEAENAFHQIYLKGMGFGHGAFDRQHINDIRPLLKDPFDVLCMGGWSEPTYMMLRAMGAVRRWKTLVWVESTALETGHSSMKERYKRLFLKGTAGCVVPGTRSAEYCRQLGVPEERIFHAPNALDTEFFRQKASELLPACGEMREAVGFERFTVLFVGRMVDELKNVSLLIRACGMLRRKGLDMTLVLVGDGPDRKRHEALAGEEGLDDVRFMGFMGHEELCRQYAMADVLVLPSRNEPWGFVLNEAMEFGLPLVVSDRVGAGPDLVHEGENGFVVSPDDAVALAGSLERIASDEALKGSMGQRSKDIVSTFTPDAWARGMLEAVRAAAQR